MPAASPRSRSLVKAKTASAAPAARLGQRNTRPRAAVVAILETAPGPLTVPEIHALAQKVKTAGTAGAVGIATVYRTLNLLVENGQARTVVPPSGETRYEAHGHKGHHDHFQCRDCGSVFDIDVCQLHGLDGVTLPGGFRVEGHELTLTGLCPACATARRPSRGKPANRRA